MATGPCKVSQIQMDAMDTEQEDGEKAKCRRNGISTVFRHQMERNFDHEPCLMKCKLSSGRSEVRRMG